MHICAIYNGNWNPVKQMVLLLVNNPGIGFRVAYCVLILLIIYFQDKQGKIERIYICLLHNESRILRNNYHHQWAKSLAIEWICFPSATWRSVWLHRFWATLLMNIKMACETLLRRRLKEQLYILSCLHLTCLDYVAI